MDSFESRSKPLDYLSDFVAGSAVFFVALPLCLGIALASGAPLMSGLIAGIVGGIVVGALSGSHTSVSGPAAGLAGLVILQISTLGSFEVFLVALFFAGLIQIAFGLLRVGFIASFFPTSVIKGLIAGIGIIIILKQVPHLFGWDMDFDGEMSFWQADNQNTFSELGRILVHEGATLVGISSLIGLVLWEKLGLQQKYRIPAPVIAVLLGLLISYFLPALGSDFIIGSEHLVNVPFVENWTELQSLIQLPNFALALSPKVAIAAISIAIVASLETLLNLNAVDKIDPEQKVSPPNRELIAQGVGNAVLGLIGGIPITSVVIRGTVNITSGAKSKRSAIIHGVLIVICFLNFPHVLNAIPLSCLAAILILTGTKLASKKIVMDTYRQGLNQFAPFMMTVLSTLLTDLLTGVVIGLATSALFILYSNFRRPLQVLEENHFGGKVRRIALANQVSFLNKAALERAVSDMVPGTHLLFDATQTNYIDADILGFITDFRDETGPARRVKVSLVGFEEKNKRLEDFVHFSEHSTNEMQDKLTPVQVLRVLKDGNERVRQGKRLHRSLEQQISATSDGQFPHGVFLSCIDSRTPAELIFDLGIGDMFSARIAGNTISEKILGSLEFACAIAGAKLIVVMGHTRCGAVSAAIEFVRTGTNISEETGCTHLETLVSDIQNIVRRTPLDTIPLKGTLEREAYEDQIAKHNVTDSIDKILDRSMTIRNLVNSGKVMIAGCIYDVRNGNITFIQEINYAKADEPSVVVRPPKESMTTNLEEAAVLY